MKFKIISIFAVAASLAACSTVADKAPAALPIIDSAKFETVDKAKTDLKTPTGTKQIYDPLQDPDVRLAFEGFSQAKQQSGYFKGWPRNLIKRWNHGRHIEKSNIIWNEFRSNTPLIDEYNKTLGSAGIAQYNDYLRAGCSSIQQDKICRYQRRIGYDFDPCSEGQTSWGDFNKSECEKRTLNEYDQILTMPRLYYKPPRPVTPEDFCLNPAHIGDPKKGSIEMQLEDYFSLTCNKFKE